MSTPRRLYVYAVCAVTLQALTHALIGLLRNIIVTGLDPERSAIASQIAIIIIALGIFLPHWLWGLRVARSEVEERESVARRLYLYGMQAALLAPVVNNAFNIAARLLAEVADGGTAQRLHPRLPAGEFILYHLAGAVVLGLVWYYHQRVVAEESSPATEVDGPATARRLYLLSFSAVGLAMMTIAIVNLLRWILLQIGDAAALSTNGPISAIARLMVGAPLWIVFWVRAERLFSGPEEEERASALRKFYLFSVVFIAALTSVTTASILLASLFRQLLKVADETQGDLRTAIATIVTMAVLWVYHGLDLREDSRRTDESAGQAGVRRLYTYLVAAIGLGAALLGLGGLVSVLILSLERSGTGSALTRQLAWSAAALIAGLPVWGWPWRGAQVRASTKGVVGDTERSSLARKLFLYFYLLAGTLVVLGSAVFLLSQILGMLLGLAGPGLSEVGHPIGFGLIAVALWLYHAAALRADRQLGIGAITTELEGRRVVVVDAGDGTMGEAVTEELKKRIPGIDMDFIRLGAASGQPKAKPVVKDQISQADLIIGPWTMTGGTQVAGEGNVKPELARAIIHSPARKLLIPTRVEGYEWAGVDRWKHKAIIRQVVSAALQILRGEQVKPVRPLGVGAIVGIVVGGLILLQIVLGPLLSLLLFNTR